MWLQLGLIGLGAFALASAHTYLERQSANKGSSSNSADSSPTKQLPKPDGSTPKGGQSVFTSQLWKEATSAARKLRK